MIASRPCDELEPFKRVVRTGLLRLGAAVQVRDANLATAEHAQVGFLSRIGDPVRSAQMTVQELAERAVRLCKPPELRAAKNSGLWINFGRARSARLFSRQTGEVTSPTTLR